MLALGDVVDHALPVQGVALAVAQQLGVVMDPDHAAVTRDRAVVDAPTVTGVFLIGGHDPGAIIRMDALLPHPGVPHPFLGCIAVDRFDLRTDVDVLAGEGVLDVDDLGEPLHQAPEPILGLREGALGRPASRHVVEHTLGVEPAVAQHRDGLVVHPDDAPVAVDHPVLHVEGLADVRGLLPRSEDIVAIVRMEHPRPGLQIAEPFVGGHTHERLDAGPDPTLADVTFARRADHVRHDGEIFQERAPPFLRLTEPVLGAVTLGDVEHHPLIDEAATRVLRDRVSLVPEPAPRSVGGAHPVLVDERSPLRDGGAPRLEHTGGIVGMRVVAPGRRVVHPVRRVVAEYVLDLRADVGGRDHARSMPPIPDVGDRRDALDQCLELPFGRERSSVRLLAGRDVVHHSLRKGRAACLVERDVVGLVADPDERSVRAVRAVFGDEPRAGVVGLRRRLQDALPVVGVDHVHPVLRVALRRDAEELLHLRAHVEVTVRRRIPAVGDGGGSLDQRSQAGVGRLPESLLPVHLG